MWCEECEKAAAEWHCEDCGQFLCAACDEILHKKGKRQAHVRGPVCPSCQPEKPCMVCLLGTPPVLKPAVLVFWEMNGMYPKTAEETKSILASIRDVYGQIKEVRAYAQSFLKLGAEMKGLGIELVSREGVTDYQSLIMDVTLKSREDHPSKLLILSSGAGRLKPFLCELMSALPKDTILVANSLDTLRFASPELMQSPASYIITSRVKPISHDFKEVRSGLRVESKESIPVLQQWTKKIVTEGVEGRLLDFLKSYANQGKIMSEINTLVSGFQHYAIAKAEQARNAVQVMLSASMIHTTNRSFGTVKTVTFVSLRAESLSLELLLWTLRSLKNDQMLPTERAIQSRMKEAFDFKPAASQWQQLLDVVIERSKRHHSLSAPDVTLHKMTSRGQAEMPEYSIPNFIVLDVLDSMTNQETKVVYPEGEKWLALDNNIKPSDAQTIKDSEEWRLFISFLEDYFVPEESKRVWRRSEEEEKAISGGRYGCAQFVKFCGPVVLTACSLGKLSFMVQLAINDDILRYQKTLLIWTPGTAKLTNEQLVSERLQQVQMAVIESLKEAPEGVSLAQLPMKVRTHLPFPLDLGELGFAKLKDLLATIPTVKVELRGSNHPFAVYIGHSAKTSASDSDAQIVLSTIKAIISENRAATPASKLESALAIRLGKAIDWRSFDCSSLGDFARKWGGNSLEVLRSNETHLALRNEMWSQHYARSYSLSAISDAFYQQVPTQKVVMISDLPVEFQGDAEEEDEENTKVEERRLSERPQFRTDSEEFHSMNPNFAQEEWYTQAQDQGVLGQTSEDGDLLESIGRIQPPPGL